MEAFHYRAFDVAGRSRSGVLQADSPRQARAQLRAQGFYPERIDRVRNRERAASLWSRSIPAAELSLLTRQLAMLLASGLTMEHALTALIEEVTAPRTREVLGGVKAEVTGGLSLAAALGIYGRNFPDYYRALVRGGEESGALPVVLQHLADYLDARQALHQKTSLALLYPMLVTFVAICVVTGLLVYVVPQIVQVFQQSRQSLPLLTRGLIAVSDFLRGAGPWLAGACLCMAMGARLALRLERCQRRWHALVLRLPWFGPVVRGLNTSRFASTLAILVGGGVPLLAALDYGARAMSNRVMHDGIRAAIERVREGESLARALAATHIFPPLMLHLVGSGEASGKLEPMLERAAQLETQTLERRLAVLLTLLEPVMILVMGGVVLIIVLAILLPIMEINQLVH
ncbi:general secretion pathway protein F [Rhodanobacter fulvus Jip2]|uniref:General secretion pathway protein F n=1 Tax=Rhodanobacter fulvus Jip2 TaxID=1163408 RepID=I4VMQ1_9GAMM|nr:type II secretion system inner membrane protein GspF [Rhodanobacter fulvus]EIL88492.1 general secretion pathway protein F [Rhodanobacter fulvus Jip2]